MTSDEVEQKASALGFALKRGLLTNAGYSLTHDTTGEKPLGGNFAAGSKQIGGFLESRLSEMAEALGFRVNKVKVVHQLHDMSAGEARSAQLATAAVYQLEKREVVRDKGRREDGLNEREDRAKRGGQDVVWTVVLADATFQEVALFLTNYAADIGADDGVETDVNRRLKKVAPPTESEMREKTAGHASEPELHNMIADVSRDYERKERSSLEEQRRRRHHAESGHTYELYLLSPEQIGDFVQAANAKRQRGEALYQNLKAAPKDARREAEAMFQKPDSDPAPKASTNYRVESKRKPRVFKEEDGSELGILKHKIVELWKQRPITAARNERLGHAFVRANDLLPRGQFDPFVEALGISRRSARGLMAQARA
jgi:hypothetical protein